MGRVLLSGLAEAELDQLIERIEWKAYTSQSVVSGDRLREIVEEVRAKNFALIDQEYEFGLIAVAVPIRNKQGQIVAAMNAATSNWTHDLRYLEEKVLPTMFQGADEVRSSFAS